VIRCLFKSLCSIGVKIWKYHWTWTGQVPDFLGKWSFTVSNKTLSDSSVSVVTKFITETYMLCYKMATQLTHTAQTMFVYENAIWFKFWSSITMTYLKGKMEKLLETSEYVYAYSRENLPLLKQCISIKSGSSTFKHMTYHFHTQIVSVEHISVMLPFSNTVAVSYICCDCWFTEWYITAKSGWTWFKWNKQFYQIQIFSNLDIHTFSWIQ
jgi:hypothetical protein